MSWGTDWEVEMLSLEIAGLASAIGNVDGGEVKPKPLIPAIEVRLVVGSLYISPGLTVCLYKKPTLIQRFFYRFLLGWRYEHRSG